eukprot:TRINITY_DN1072_c0_g2_i14.p1 TRINITY_DN1072_c0_g2~~TRINITY_DN1072_c0_g2_i14.p1  ORF type:complete len:269 (-),score=39.22 TRINITY_DN1072_c0_g2_i14:397-1203(-)
MAAMAVQLVGPELVQSLGITLQKLIELFSKVCPVNLIPLASVFLFFLLLTPSSSQYLHKQFKSNNYNIYDSSMETVAIGLYPILSLINHSCDPNSVPIFEGRSVKLVCIRPIQPGDEITISYIETAAPTHVRIAELQSNFFFTCTCPKCLDLSEDELFWSCKSGVDHQMVELQLHHAEKHLLELGKDNKEEAKTFCEQLLQIVSTAYPRMSYATLKYNNFVAKKMFELEEWERARDCLVKALPVCERVYPHVWPLRALHYFSLGKLDL